MRAPGWRLLALVCVGAILGACQPSVPSGEKMGEGGWEFFLNGEKVGSESYLLRRSGRQLQCTIRSDFPEALVRASGRLLLSARYRPLEFKLEATRPPGGALEVDVSLESRRARVRVQRGDLVREDWVALSPNGRLLEEGLVTLGQMALQGLDLRRDRFTLPVLLPQQFLEVEVQVENLGLERIAVGNAVERPLRHIRLSLAGGASDYWLDDQRRVVRYVSRLPAGELEALRQPEPSPEPSSTAPSASAPEAGSGD